LKYVTDGLTEALIAALGQVPALKVVSASGAALWRDPATPRDSVARALDAGTLVQGSVEAAGDKLRVQLRLVDGNSGVDLSGRRATFDLPAAELLVLRDSLANRAADLIRQRLGEEIRVRREREGTSSVAAWSLVQQAREQRRAGETAARTSDDAGFTKAFGRADSLASAAAKLDPSWPEPLVLRGQLAYRRAYFLGQNDPQAASPWIDSGLVQIASAYAIQPNNPDALEVRGNLRYWRWLLQLERDDAKATKLLNSAKIDLEQATRLNPAQAGAWATLSHLYYQTGSGVDVSLAARRALEADAFLDNADKILQRLFTVSYDLGQFTDADHWCKEIQHRFPDNEQAVICQLQMLTTRASKPDVPLAWRMADSLVALSPEQGKAYNRMYYANFVAGVLARAGQTDSAKRVLQRSAGNPQIDPQGELAFVSAFAYTLLGDKAKAVEKLKAYFTSSPGRRAAFQDDPGWWFRDLAGYPAYQQLIGGK
jgi:serine/threonine-protein kinase